MKPDHSKPQSLANGEKMDAEAAYREERGEGAAATLGKFANVCGSKWAQKESACN